MDDFHKPTLDAIGFQELIAEEAAAWSTELTEDYKHVPVLHCVVKYDVIPLYDEKEKYDIRGGIIVGTDCDVPNWKVYNSEFVISTIKNLCNTDDCVLKIRGDIEHKIEPSFWDVPLKNT